MSLMQIRQGGQTGNDGWYAPNRDLANCGPALLASAITALDPEFHEPWFKEFLTKFDVKDEDMAAAATCMATAMMAIVEAEHPPAALEAAGFTELPVEAQAAMYIRLGQILLGGVFSSVKDVSKQGDEPPASIKELTTVARDTIIQYNYTKSPPIWTREFWTGRQAKPKSQAQMLE